jgi:hypothetical protein
MIFGEKIELKVYVNQYEEVSDRHAYHHREVSDRDAYHLFCVFFMNY